MFATESGSNKQQASKNCALSLVRQLYHLKVIEAYSGVRKKKPSDEVPTYNCGMDAVLEQRISDYLSKIGQQPVTPV